jgi:prepilin-type N-terminal cleavage/methylation domain-containing protein
MRKIRFNTGKSVRIDNQKGYTLIELISILVIMGVLVSVVMKKYDFLSDSASTTAIETGLRELRTRESITWFKTKLSDIGYTNDTDVFTAIETDLGQGYNWDPGPDIEGGTLHFKSQSVNLSRGPSTRTSPGSWM